MRHIIFTRTLVLLVSLLLVGNVLAQKSSEKGKKMKEIATVGGGCFWCIEAPFDELVGVQKAVSGYSGGHVKNPTYEQVSAKNTGHAEVVQIT